MHNLCSISYAASDYEILLVVFIRWQDVRLNWKLLVSCFFMACDCLQDFINVEIHLNLQSIKQEFVQEFETMLVTF